jgi:DNA-binding protein Fis
MEVCLGNPTVRSDWLGEGRSGERKKLRQRLANGRDIC